MRLLAFFMQTMPLPPTFFLAAITLLGLAGCSKPHEARAPAPAAATAHAHHAPHGGTLVPLGQHLYNLEFVHDSENGRLTAYLLDAHAENFIRGPLAAINLTVEVSDTPKPLTLVAVANSATGETVGDTSEYSVQVDWLKTTAAPLKIVIPVLIIREATFKNISASLEMATAR